ncbi:MAG: hypothetical protein AB8B97_16680 [Granulosicoccus sp.]
MILIRSVPGFLLIAACLLQIQCTAKEDLHHNEQLAPFFGTYTGNSVNVVKGEVSERDLAVIIKPREKKGFTLEWTAVTYRGNGEKKVSETSIDFFPSARPGIFASAMKKNVFGHTVSYDPVGIDKAPYVWAGLEDKTLTVRALYISDSGGYEIHTYKRTLTEGGLSLDFDRIRDGEVVTEVQAMLSPQN